MQCKWEERAKHPWSADTGIFSSVLWFDWVRDISRGIDWNIFGFFGLVFLWFFSFPFFFCFFEDVTLHHYDVHCTNEWDASTVSSFVHKTPNTPPKSNDLPLYSILLLSHHISSSSNSWPINQLCNDQSSSVHQCDLLQRMFDMCSAASRKYLGLWEDH